MPPEYGPRAGRCRDREGEASRAWRADRLTAACLCCAVITACTPPASRDVSGGYDRVTGQLVHVQADQNGDGRIDQWSYVAGTRVIRGEADTDADGRIDRWEYFDAQSRLERVGTSSLNDGIEDTWTWTNAVNGEGRIDRSQARDRRIDRHEYYRNAVLVRSEEDTNGDGRLDRWDHYEGSIRRQADFDTTFGAGRPNRRVMFDGQGRFVRVEADPEFDGTFVTVREPAPGAVRGGQRR